MLRLGCSSPGYACPAGSTSPNVSICATQPKLAMCTYISNMIDYSFSIAFIPMRNKQDEVSLRLHNELDGLATDDESIQYILVGVCIGLVIISTMVIIPIFIFVIRDKSYVFRIFSYIEEKEIKKIINNCKKLDLKNMRYKRRWLAHSAGNPEIFWKKIIAENTCKTGKYVVKPASNDDFTSFLLKPKSEEKKAGSSDIIESGPKESKEYNLVEGKEEDTKKAAANKENNKTDSLDNTKKESAKKIESRKESPGSKKESPKNKGSKKESTNKIGSKKESKKKEKSKMETKKEKDDETEEEKKEGDENSVGDEATEKAKFEAELKKDKRIGTLSEIE